MVIIEKTTKSDKKYKENLVPENVEKITIKKHFIEKSFNDLLHFAIDEGVMDLTIIENLTLYARIKKEWVCYEDIIIKSDLIQRYLAEISEGTKIKDRLYEPSTIDGAIIYNYKGDLTDQHGTHNFRFNICLISNGLSSSVSISLRHLVFKVPTFEDINLIGSSLTFYEKISELNEGIYLIAGGTGSGKSTTIFSMLDNLLSTKSLKAVSAESPIEFMFDNKKYQKNGSHIMQRDIGLQSKSFYSALVDAMRQTPNLIFLGEIRDLETAKAAIYASQSGHTVLATIHAESVSETKTRWLDLLEKKDENSDVMKMVKGIMHQKLIRFTDENDKVLFVQASREVWIKEEKKITDKIKLSKEEIEEYLNWRKSIEVLNNVKKQGVSLPEEVRKKHLKIIENRPKCLEKLS